MRKATTIPKTSRPPVVAVIGAATPDGARLSLVFALAGSRVLLFDADPRAAEAVRAEILRSGASAGVEVLPCEKESCWEADLIVLAAPLGALDRIREVSTGKIVLAAGIASGHAATLCARLPHARIVTLVGTEIVPAREDADARDTVRRLLAAGERALRAA